MKKIDFHIHTVSTISDHSFTFNLDTLRRYVSVSGLHAIAITNHNMFDGIQFRAIEDALDAIVFPGVEVNLDGGHILVISDIANLEEFEDKVDILTKRINKNTDSISIEDLEIIFGDLNNYLLIPHYDKDPPHQK